MIKLILRTKLLKNITIKQIKYAVIIAIRHGTTAALKGNVKLRSDCFIARYAHTTPISNVATSDQSIFYLRHAQSHSSRW